MNRVMLIGNLTRDPELRTTTSGKTVATFTLAINRRNSSQESACDFVNCLCWEKLAEAVSKYLSKGKKAAVSGSLRSRTYEASDGTKRAVLEVLAEDIEFLTAKAAMDTTGPSTGISGSQRQQQTGQALPNGYRAVSVDDEELPF